jgi:hypothetical protein
MWPQETDLLFRNHVALKQACLLLHKLSGRNTDLFHLKYVIENQRSCFYTNNVAAKVDVLFQITWSQNKRAYYTNKVATTSVITVPKILGLKTSALIAAKITWPQHTALL